MVQNYVSQRLSKNDNDDDENDDDDDGRQLIFKFIVSRLNHLNF